MRERIRVENRTDNPYKITYGKSEVTLNKNEFCDFWLRIQIDAKDKFITISGEHFIGTCEFQGDKVFPYLPQFSFERIEGADDTVKDSWALCFRKYMCGKIQAFGFKNKEESEDARALNIISNGVAGGLFEKLRLSYIYIIDDIKEEFKCFCSFSRSHYNITWR